MSTKYNILSDYKKKCGTFTVEREKDDDNQYDIIYIETERFISKTLCTTKTNFDDYSDEIKDLYKFVFSDLPSISSYGYGVPYSINKFENLVQRRSFCALNNYPLHGFIVIDKNTNQIAGYQELHDTDIHNTAEISYLFNKHYHSSALWKYVGYENVGALCYELYESSNIINRTFSTNSNVYEGGTLFKCIFATARIDNPASIKILKNLSFQEGVVKEKYGHQRQEFLLNFEKF